MKTIVCLLLIISLNLCPIHAQKQSVIDSLKNELSIAKEDTNKVNVLQSLGLNLLNSHPEESQKRALQILELSKKLEYPKGIAAAYNLMALNEEQRGNYAKTIEYHFKALEILETEQEEENIANLYHNIGKAYGLQKDFEQSSKYLIKGLKFFEKMNNHYGIAISCNVLGISYRNQNDFESAISYHTKGLQHAKKTKNNNLIARISLNLAGDLDYTENFELVVQSFNNALDAFIKMDDKKGEAIALNNLGAAYLENKKNEKAIVFLLRSIEKAKTIKFKPLISHNYLLINKAYSENKNFQKANEYALMLNDINDSLLDESKLKIINELETKYQVEKKEQEIVLQERKIEILEKDKKIRNYTLYGLLIFVILLIISGLGWFRNYKNKKIAKEMEIRYQLDLYIKEIELLKNTSKSEQPNTQELDSSLKDFLSEREFDVLTELSKGNTNKEIGETLFISVNTVKSHLKSIYEKLDVKNRTQAVKKIKELNKNSQ